MMNVVRRAIGRLVGQLPWWVAFLVGLACLGLGVWIVAKPFDSLSTTVLLVGSAFVVVGIAEMAAARALPAPGLTLVAGAGWIIAGVVALGWPGITIEALAILAGISLLLGGLGKIVLGIRGTVDDRLITGVSGLAGIIFGGLALSWPDVTVLVLALLVGPAIIIFGVGQCAAALARRGEPAEPDSAPLHAGRRRPRWIRAIGATMALVVALGLLGVSAWLHGEETPPDAFYTPPAGVPDEPGILLRSEPFARAIPETARAWRILYTTTRDDETPAVASAIVVISKSAPAGPRPVIAWAHGTTGVDASCAPSLLPTALASGALPALDEVIANGWVLVATDYVGLGTAGPHPYLIGQPEGRSVLDAVRAAGQIGEVELAEQTVVWGHSQGGHAALWTGILATTYAPDINVVGVASLAPASDLVGLMDAMAASPFAAILQSYVVDAYSRVYSDVRFDDYVRPEARTYARETATRCLAAPALISVIGALPFGGSITPPRPLEGPLVTRLAENVPAAKIAAPLLIAQGLSDLLILPAVQQEYVDARCAAGQRLEYRTYSGRNHVPLVEDDSPLIPYLISWTQDRFDGVPQEEGCRFGVD